jgi:hypothetical protein
MLAGLLALTVAALFTAAAFYVGFAEQSARLLLDGRVLLQVRTALGGAATATFLWAAS